MLIDTTWTVSPSSPLLGGVASDDAAGRYLGLLVERGYRLTGPVPLTEGDRTVHFVNANVTPHKPTLQAGEPIGRLCAYQHCFRAHGEHPWLFAFGMAGLLTDLADPDDLARIAVDSHDATVAAVPDQRADRIHVLVDAADEDLIGGVTAAATPTGGTVHALADSAISTRWDYGEGFDLRGRGVTYYYRRPDVGCEQECRPDCKDPRACRSRQGRRNGTQRPVPRSRRRWMPTGNDRRCAAALRSYGAVPGVKVQSKVSTFHLPVVGSVIRAMVTSRVLRGAAGNHLPFGFFRAIFDQVSTLA
jgi:hypothetical protein